MKTKAVNRAVKLEVTISRESYQWLPPLARVLLDTYDGKPLGGGVAWKYHLAVSHWRRLEPYAHHFQTRALRKIYADRLKGTSGQCRYCRCTDDHACPGGCSWIDPLHTVCSECAAWILVGGSSDLRQSLGNVRDERRELA